MKEEYEAKWREMAAVHRQQLADRTAQDQQALACGSMTREMLIESAKALSKQHTETGIALNKHYSYKLHCALEEAGGSGATEPQPQPRQPGRPAKAQAKAQAQAQAQATPRFASQAAPTRRSSFLPDSAPSRPAGAARAGAGPAHARAAPVVALPVRPSSQLLKDAQEATALLMQQFANLTAGFEGEHVRTVEDALARGVIPKEHAQLMAEVLQHNLHRVERHYPAILTGLSDAVLRIQTEHRAEISPLPAQTLNARLSAVDIRRISQLKKYACDLGEGYVSLAPADLTESISRQFACHLLQTMRQCTSFLKDTVAPQLIAASGLGLPPLPVSSAGPGPEAAPSAPGPSPVPTPTSMGALPSGPAARALPAGPSTTKTRGGHVPHGAVMLFPPAALQAPMQRPHPPPPQHPILLPLPAADVQRADREPSAPMSFEEVDPEDLSDDDEVAPGAIVAAPPPPAAAAVDTCTDDEMCEVQVALEGNGWDSTDEDDVLVYDHPPPPVVHA